MFRKIPSQALYDLQSLLKVHDFDYDFSFNIQLNQEEEILVNNVVNMLKIKQENLKEKRLELKKKTDSYFAELLIQDATEKLEKQELEEKEINSQEYIIRVYKDGFNEYNTTIPNNYNEEDENENNDDSDVNNK